MSYNSHTQEQSNRFSCTHGRAAGIEARGNNMRNTNESGISLAEHGKNLTGQKKPQENQTKGKEDLKSFNRTSKFTNGRSKSAPSRPLTEQEIFRRSKEFIQLEGAALSLLGLIITPDGKLDLDSAEGSTRGKHFLRKLEELALTLNINPADRTYREGFSRPYKALYVGGPLCYLTEILDSVQERLPFIIVNSEKYIFSTNVLITGDKLFSTFLKVKVLIRDIYYM